MSNQAAPFRKAKKHITASASETQRIARALSRQLLERGPGASALVLSLRGDLGAGKTTFVQGVARGLGIEEKVLSPTFILLRRFKLSRLAFKNFYHIDCYRLNDERDMEALDFREIISNPLHIVAIEWPEKIAGYMPSDVIEVAFQHKGKDRRMLTVSY